MIFVTSEAIIALLGALSKPQIGKQTATVLELLEKRTEAFSGSVKRNIKWQRWLFRSVEVEK